MPAPQPSVFERILEAFKVCLFDNLDEVGNRVERGREDAYSEREDGSINIKAKSADSRVFGEDVDDTEGSVELEIYVKELHGTIWESRADLILVAANALLHAYASWPAGMTQLRITGRSYGGDGEDRQPGLLTATYAVRFLAMTTALDKAP